MNRRAFLTRVTKTTAAAIVLAHVPVEWVPRAAGLQECVALCYLRKAYNEWSKDHFGKHPDTILVGQDLYNQVESEIMTNERFYTTDGTPRDPLDTPTLVFRAARLKAQGPGWRIISMESTRAKA